MYHVLVTHNQNPARLGMVATLAHYTEGPCRQPSQIVVWQDGTVSTVPTAYLCVEQFWPEEKPLPTWYTAPEQAEAGEDTVPLDLALTPMGIAAARQLSPVQHLVALRPSPAVLPQAQPSTMEALCSVNVKTCINGMSAQITGRGNTPEEAVAYLTATLAQTQAALAPQPPSPTQVFGEWMCQLKKRQLEPKQERAIAAKWVKALLLVLHKQVWASASQQGVWEVVGQEQAVYAVRQEEGCKWSCECKAAQSQPGCCKHVCATKMLLECQG